MLVYEVTPDNGCCAHTEDSISSAILSAQEWLNESDEGTILTIKVKEMSQEDYGNLPEYEGP